MYVAGYGPKALAVAGRVGDGVIIQLADPVIIEWIMATARASAEKEGRDPDALECIVGAPSKVSDDLAQCREEVRWFPAMVSNHVMDLIERYGWDSDIPSELTDFVKARKFYDYKDHSRVGAAHGEFVTDEICDRFCVIGSAERVHQEAARARGGRRRPVQRLPDDERPGRDARGLRPRHHPAVRGRRSLKRRSAERPSGRAVVAVGAADLVRDPAIRTGRARPATSRARSPGPSAPARARRPSSPAS